MGAIVLISILLTYGYKNYLHSLLVDIYFQYSFIIFCKFYPQIHTNTNFFYIHISNLNKIVLNWNEFEANTENITK